MSLFTHPEFDGHETVVFCHDAASGLKAVIAIHNTRRGPAVGGCRMWPYATEEAALTDALRLSRGMTYKNALADLAFGGGKSVIIGDPQRDKSEALFRAMGRFVEGLGGRYIIAEDVGTSVEDVEIMERFLEPHPWQIGVQLAVYGGGAIAACLWFWRYAEEVNRFLMSGGIAPAAAIMAAVAMIAWGYGKAVQCLLRAAKLDIY